MNLKEVNMDFLPQWNDDERILVMMGPMPPKESVAYRGRVKFWSSMLHGWIRSSNRFSFTLEDVQEAFRKDTVVPVCLPEILQNLLRQGEIAFYEDIMRPDTSSESWKQWSKSILSSSAKWSWNKLVGMFGREGTETCFVDCKVLQDVSEQIYRTWWWDVGDKPDNHNPDSVFTVDKVFPLLDFYVNSFEDLNIVLQFLLKQRKLSILVHENETYVKFLKPGNLELPNITHTQIAELKLIRTEEILKERLFTNREKCEDLKSEAKKLVANGHRKEALSLLRNKKMFEKVLDKTASSLENITSLLLQLQQSRFDMEVLSVFKMSLRSLRSTLSANAVEDASETMDAIQDALDECGEIGDAVAFSVSTDGDSDSTTLDSELEELMALVTLEEDRDSVKDNQLPDVPITDPMESILQNEKLKA